MARIKIENLERNHELSQEEIKRIFAGSTLARAQTETIIGKPRIIPLYNSQSISLQEGPLA